jgi:hypothetical protein
LLAALRQLVAAAAPHALVTPSKYVASRQDLSCAVSRLREQRSTATAARAGRWEWTGDVCRLGLPWVAVGLPWVAAVAAAAVAGLAAAALSGRSLAGLMCQAGVLSQSQIQQQYQK